MIRKFSTFGVINIKNVTPALYSLTDNQFTITSRSLSPHSSWQYYTYAYDDSTGYKYFAVDPVDWVRFDNEQLNIVRDFNNDDGNYTVTVDKDFNFSNKSSAPDFYPVGIFKTQENDDDLFSNAGEGSSFITNAGIEKGPQTINWNDSSKYFAWLTAFKVDNVDFFDNHGLFANSKLTKSSGTIPNARVTPITKIIRINSVSPDYFDYDGNAIEGLNYNLGHQILSDGIYNSNEKTGFKIGDNQYVNISDATGTSLMYGKFYPTNKGVN